jgi:hypothetical protein
MAITRAQQARQMLQEGSQVLGPLGEDDLQTDFVSKAKGLLTPGNIGRAAAFIFSGGATSAAEVAKEIAKQKILNEIQNKVGETIGPRIETKLMQQQNEARGTGGYQSDFSQDSGFMGGSGTAAEMGSFADGGRIGFKNGPAGGASAGGNYGGDSSGGYSDKERTENRTRGGPPGTDVVTKPPVKDKYGDDTQKRFDEYREEFINEPVKFPKYTPSYLKIFEVPLSKGQAVTRKFNIDKVAKAGRYQYTDPVTGKTYTFDQDLALENPEIFEAANKQLLQDRNAGKVDAFGNPNPGFGKDDNNFIPVDTTFAQAPTEEVLSPIQQAILDRGTPSAFLAEGGMPKDAPVGGIMDLESGRQMYFLGKLVKKATRAVKKIVKSPIGKAALFAAPFLMSGGAGGIGAFLKQKAAPFLFKGGADFAAGKMGLGKLLTSGLTGGGSLALGGALTLAPLLFQQEEDQPDFASSRGPELPASIADIRNNYRQYMGTAFLADGGTPEPVAKKTMPLLDMDGKEMDLRAEGGFVPIGRMEKADDVPARLSKNEFVFTADAVRNAGDGDVDKGAEVMYNMMKNLESGGDVSEESQGLEGARRMFQTSQRLEEVL